MEEVVATSLASRVVNYLVAFSFDETVGPIPKAGMKLPLATLFVAIFAYAVGHLVEMSQVWLERRAKRLMTMAGRAEARARES